MHVRPAPLVRIFLNTISFQLHTSAHTHTHTHVLATSTLPISGLSIVSPNYMMTHHKGDMVGRLSWMHLVQMEKDGDLPPGQFEDLETDRFTIPLASLPKDAGAQPLCHKYQRITMEVLDTEPGYQHHDPEDLMRSAKLCQACNLIQETICTAATRHAREQSRIESP